MRHFLSRIVRCERVQARKKGPLALASGPSLGRKRPRRAATARSAIALQQYAAASHQNQVLFAFLPCISRMSHLAATCDIVFEFRRYINVLMAIHAVLDTTESHRQT